MDIFDGYEKLITPTEPVIKEDDTKLFKIEEPTEPIEEPIETIVEPIVEPIVEKAFKLSDDDILNIAERLKELMKGE